MLFPALLQKSYWIPVDSEVDAATEIGDSESHISSGKSNKSFIKSLAYTIGGIVLLFVAFMAYNLFFADKHDDPADEITEPPPSFSEIDQDTAKLTGITITPYKPPEKLDLHLRARQDVWVVVARDGDTVMNRQLSAGEERRWQADYRFVLTVGISTAVELTLNGTRLAPLADRAQTIAGLEINQVNYWDFYPDESAEDEITPSREIPVRPRFGAADQPAAADSTDEDSSDGN